MGGATVHLEAKLRSAAEEDQVSLEDYEEIFIPEFAKRVVELVGCLTLPHWHGVLCPPTLWDNPVV